MFLLGVLIGIVVIPGLSASLGSLAIAWKRRHAQCKRTVRHVSDYFAFNENAFIDHKINHADALFSQSVGGDSAGVQWEATRRVMSEIIVELNTLDRMTENQFLEIRQGKKKSLWSFLFRRTDAKTPVNAFPRTGLASGWRLRDAGSCGVRNFAEIDNFENRFYIRTAVGAVTSRASKVYMSEAFVPQTNDLVNVVLKYANNCVSLFRKEYLGIDSEDEQDLDPLFFEFVIMRTLNWLASDSRVGSWQLSPHVFSLSQPAVPIESEWGEDFRFGCQFLVEHPRTLFSPKFKEIIASCSDFRASVRAMVEERVKQTLTDRVVGLSGSFHFTPKEIVKKIIKLGIESVIVLQELHRLGFLHGDIHSSNIALMDMGKREQIVLIDFGSSKFFPAEIGKPEFKKFKSSLRKSLLSPWNLQHKRIGRRDDLFRALETIAVMIQVSQHVEYIRKRLTRLDGKNDIAKMVEFKLTASYFSDICLIAFRNSRAACDAAMNQLELAMNSVRAIPNVDSKPDYAYVISQMQKSIDLLENVMEESVDDDSDSLGG